MTETNNFDTVEIGLISYGQLSHCSTIYPDKTIVTNKAEDFEILDIQVDYLSEFVQLRQYIDELMLSRYRTILHGCLSPNTL